MTVTKGKTRTRKARKERSREEERDKSLSVADTYPVQALFQKLVELVARAANSKKKEK